MRKTASQEIIYGRQPVLELLRADRREIKRVVMFHRVRVSEPIKSIRKLTRSKGLPLEEVDHPALDRLVGGVNHQGVAAETGGYPYVSMENLNLKECDGEPLWLLLDRIQDPQNLGAIFRSADAAGVDAVFIPSERAAGVTPAVTRASAGASEHIRVCRVENLPTTLSRLREQGCIVCGMDGGPESVSYTEADMRGPLAVVIGGEGEGMSRQVRRNCDFLVKLPMRGKVNSLNAAAATAVTLYEILRRRGIS